MEDLPAPYGPNVRVICRAGQPPSCNLCVEVREEAGWREIGRFNDMSDSYAHSNARTCAMRARQKLLEGEVP